jgi:bifunctional DNA-binding transcriptional regulator/antitoxin component of YhaV-PrlF toxin-antitoxin module
MKTYKLQELQGRYFITVPSEYVRELALKKGDRIKFNVEGCNMIITKDNTPTEETKIEPVEDGNHI